MPYRTTGYNRARGDSMDGQIVAVGSRNEMSNAGHSFAILNSGLVSIDPEMAPHCLAMSKNTFAQPEEQPQISPLRYASVEMTKERLVARVRNDVTVFHPLGWAEGP
jgi:hypothetical protein